MRAAQAQGFTIYWGWNAEQAEVLRQDAYRLETGDYLYILEGMGNRYDLHTV